MFNPFKIWVQMTRDMLESNPGTLGVAFLMMSVMMGTDTYVLNSLFGYVPALLGLAVSVLCLDLWAFKKYGGGSSSSN